MQQFNLKHILKIGLYKYKKYERSTTKKLDLDLDWDRELATCNEDYYQYQQELL